MSSSPRSRSRIRCSWSMLLSFSWLAIMLGGCCHSTESTEVFPRGVDDQGKSCEDICREVIVSELPDLTQTFLACEEHPDPVGSSVVCHYNDSVCTTELR